MKKIWHQNNNGFSVIALLVVIALISSIALVGYYVATQANTPDMASENESLQTTANSQEAEANNNEIAWAEYSNPDLGIRFSYPESWGEIEIDNQEKNRGGCCSYIGEWYVISFDSNNDAANTGNFISGYITTLDFEYTAPGVGGHLFSFPGGDFPVKSFNDFLQRNKDLAFPSYELLHSGPNYVVNGSILRDSLLGHGVMILADIDLDDQLILRVGYFHELSTDELALEKDDDNITSIPEILPEKKYNEFIEFAKINSLIEE